MLAGRGSEKQLCYP